MRSLTHVSTFPSFNQQYQLQFPPFEFSEQIYASPPPLELQSVPEQAQPKNLIWVKGIQAGKERHPTHGKYFWYYIRLLSLKAIQLNGFPKEVHGELPAFGIGDYPEHSMRIKIQNHAYECFRSLPVEEGSMKSFETTLFELIEEMKLQGPWLFRAISIFGGTSLRDLYFRKLLDQRILKISSKARAILIHALNSRPVKPLKDIDTHFHVVTPPKHALTYICKALSSISKNLFLPNEIQRDALSNNIPFAKTLLVTLGESRASLDILLTNQIPEKIPYQFSKGTLEYPIYDNNGKALDAFKPECYSCDPLGALFQSAIGIDYIPNWNEVDLDPGHPALNPGLFLKICVEITKGYMLFQDLTEVSIPVFLKKYENADEFRLELNGKFRHLDSQSPYRLAYVLNLLNAMRGKHDFSLTHQKVCLELLSTVFFSGLCQEISELIKKYPLRIEEILCGIKAAAICAFATQRTALEDSNSKTKVILTIYNGRPALAVDLGQEAFFTFEIDAEEVFSNQISMSEGERGFSNGIKAVYNEFFSGTTAAVLPSGCEKTNILEELAAVGLGSSTVLPIFVNLLNAGSTFCLRSAFYLSRICLLAGHFIEPSIITRCLQQGWKNFPSKQVKETILNLAREICPDIVESDLTPPAKKPELDEIAPEIFLQNCFSDNPPSSSNILRKICDLIQNYENHKDPKKKHIQISKLLIKEIVLGKIYFGRETSWQSLERRLFSLLLLLKDNQETATACQLLEWMLNQNQIIVPSAYWDHLLLLIQSNRSLDYGPILALIRRSVASDQMWQRLCDRIPIEGLEALREDYPDLFVVEQAPEIPQEEDHVPVFTEIPRTTLPPKMKLPKGSSKKSASRQRYQKKIQKNSRLTKPGTKIVNCKKSLNNFGEFTKYVHQELSAIQKEISENGITLEYDLESKKIQGEKWWDFFNELQIVVSSPGMKDLPKEFIKDLLLFFFEFKQINSQVLITIQCYCDLFEERLQIKLCTILCEIVAKYYLMDKQHDEFRRGIMQILYSYYLTNQFQNPELERKILNLLQTSSRIGLIKRTLSCVKKISDVTLDVFCHHYRMIGLVALCAGAGLAYYYFRDPSEEEEPAILSNRGKRVARFLSEDSQHLGNAVIKTFDEMRNDFQAGLYKTMVDENNKVYLAYYPWDNKD